MDENRKAQIVLNVKLENLESCIEKVKQYVELLEEAKTLAEDLASLDLRVEVI